MNRSLATYRQETEEWGVVRINKCTVLNQSESSSLQKSQTVSIEAKHASCVHNPMCHPSKRPVYNLIVSKQNSLKKKKVIYDIETNTYNDKDLSKQI